MRKIDDATKTEIARAICGAGGCPLQPDGTPSNPGCSYGCSIGRTTWLFDSMNHVIAALTKGERDG